MDQWRHGQFSASELTNPAISGDTADPDLDGLSNLAEYSLGLSPKSADAANSLAAQIVNGRLSLTYPRRKKATDVSVVAEGSHDLHAWSSGAVEFVSKQDDGDLERITVRLATPPEQAPQGFLRLRTTR